ncbi:MAG: DUF3618 domain-containing protein, partial [Kineosporiaceae bacterium]
MAKSAGTGRAGDGTPKAGPGDRTRTEPGTTDPGTTDPETVEPLPTDPEALVRFIEQRRTRLASTIEELTTRATPGSLVRRGTAGARARVRAATRTEDGALRVERVAA